MKVRRFHASDFPSGIEYMDRMLLSDGATRGYKEACKDHQDVFDACQALYDHFLSRGGNPDSLLGIQVKEALKKARGV